MWRHLLYIKFKADAMGFSIMLIISYNMFIAHYLCWNLSTFVKFSLPKSLTAVHADNATYSGEGDLLSYGFI